MVFVRLYCEGGIYIISKFSSPIRKRSRIEYNHPRACFYDVYGIILISLETHLISHPHELYGQIMSERSHLVSQVREQMHLCIIGTF